MWRGILEHERNGGNNSEERIQERCRHNYRMGVSRLRQVLEEAGGGQMSEYKVTIKITEKYTVKVEARTESDAIAKAFDNRYGWVYQYDTDLYKVKAEVVSE